MSHVAFVPQGAVQDMLYNHLAWLWQQTSSMKKACPPARPTQKPPMDFISPSRILEEGHLRRGSDGSSVQATATTRELTRRQSPPSEAHAWETTCESPYTVSTTSPCSKMLFSDGWLPRRFHSLKFTEPLRPQPQAQHSFPVLVFSLCNAGHSTSVTNITEVYTEVQGGG